jgi:hypothetical protein
MMAYPKGPYRFVEGVEYDGWCRIDVGPAHPDGDPDYEQGGGTLISEDDLGDYDENGQAEVKSVFKLFAAAPEMRQLLEQAFKQTKGTSAIDPIVRGRIGELLDSLPPEAA